MPQPPPATTQGTVWITRIIHGALIVSILLWLDAADHRSSSDPQPIDKTLLAMLGAWLWCHDDNQLLPNAHYLEVHAEDIRPRRRRHPVVGLPLISFSTALTLTAGVGIGA
jgi:hypothetical protein